MIKNIRDWQNAFLQGKFASVSKETANDAGWYKPDCSDACLSTKTYEFGKIISQIKDEGKVDLDHNCVNLTSVEYLGNFYEVLGFSFRPWSDYQDDALLIHINDQYFDHKYTVFSNENDFTAIVFESDSITELITWLNKPWKSINKEERQNDNRGSRRKIK